MIASSRYSDASNGPTVNINYTDNVTYCKKEKAHISHLEEKKKKKKVGWGGGVVEKGWGGERRQKIERREFASTPVHDKVSNWISTFL